jgi:hypothetical protein
LTTHPTPPSPALSHAQPSEHKLSYAEFLNIYCSYPKQSLVIKQMTWGGVLWSWLKIKKFPKSGILFFFMFTCTYFKLRNMVNNSEVKKSFPMQT